MSEIVQKVLSLLFSVALTASLFVTLNPAFEKIFEEQSKLKYNEQINTEALEILSEMSNFNSTIFRLKNSSNTNVTFRFHPKYHWKLIYSQNNLSESIFQIENRTIITIIAETTQNKTKISINSTFDYPFSVYFPESPDPNKNLYLIKEGDDIIVRN